MVQDFIIISSSSFLTLNGLFIFKMSENTVSNGESQAKDPIPIPIETSTPTKTWVQFEDETSNGKKSEPAVITTENVQVLERSFSKPSPVHVPNSSTNNDEEVLDPKPMRNVELPVATVEPIRQGFANGDVIVTLLPVNTKFPWITPAKFRPELVPEELMAQGLTLTVEEYVQAMELLVNDFRFTLYNICYKRVLVLWILLAFLVLFGVLFSNQSGATLFVLGIGWLMFNAAAIFFSIWVKFKLTRNLEKCLAHVNKQLLRHRIVIALDDRGKISCHKVTLCFLYMDSGPCINHLQSSIDQQERDQNSGWEQKMDITANDIVIQGSRTTRLSRKQERATLLYLRYIARWGKEVVRGYVVSPPAKGGRHCHSLTCPCQYIDEHLYCKPPGPTLLSLRKHFRKSLLLDQSQRIATNNSISVIEISSGDSGCSNDVKEFKSCSKIIIEESNSEGGNTQETNVSHISNINSDNEEIIPPSPNRKKITYECVSTSKIKKLSKLHCGDLPKTKLFEIMKWKKDVEEFNKEVLDKEKIQPYDSIERSVVSYDEFENKRKLEENQLLNSTMLPIPMKNNDCGDYKYIDKFYDDTRHKKSLQELDNKFVSSSDEDGNLNKSCEDLLDELYGSSWRLKRDEVLSKSEKKLRKKNVLERENLPKSERKSKQSDYDSKKLNQNNLLKLVQRRGIKKVIDFPIMEDCCDEKQYNDNESLKTLARDIMNCDLSQKVSAIHPNKVLEKEIESFEFRDSKKYDDENKIDFSDKENVYSLKIISLDNKELECSGSGEKLKETHKLKKKKVQVKGDKNNLQTRDNNQKEPMFSTITEKAADKLPDTKDIVCHIKNEEKNCLNDKVRKTKTKESTEIDSDIENFTLKSVEEIEIINRSEKTRYSFLESLSKHIPDSQCNIKAKIFRNNYKQYKEHLAKKLFDLYNKEIFNNALPNTTVLEWNIRMSSTAGFCHSKKITHRSGDVERISKIVLSAKVLDSADRLRDTLIHEMCHAATWVVDQISNGHGECWMAWTNKARQVFPELPPIKRCHNYQINTKYTYRCTGCGYSIGRHRKSLDIERKRCGYCLGKFEVLINKVNKKGQQKTVPSTPKREPTGFALFVKENYSHFKAPGVNHGSVMKLLSEKFNEMKV